MKSQVDSSCDSTFDCDSPSQIQSFVLHLVLRFVAFCVARSQIIVAKRKISSKTNEICTTVSNGGTNISTGVLKHLDLIFLNETSYLKHFPAKWKQEEIFSYIHKFLQPFYKTWVFLGLKSSRKTQNEAQNEIKFVLLPIMAI